jgi:hypothetical protein
MSLSPRSQESESSTPGHSPSIVPKGKASRHLTDGVNMDLILTSANTSNEALPWTSVAYLGIQPATGSLQPTFGPGHDHCLLPLPSLTIYSALYTNGYMLGIPCVVSLAAKSCRSTTSDIPLSLQLTPTQLGTVHFLFVDRFPLPKLRDKMIELQDEFSAEEFIADLFTNPSFSISSGYQGWDPAAWSVSPIFKRKWSFLF